MKFYTILGLVLLLVVVGCCRKGTSTTTTIVDSTAIVEVPRLVQVNIPGDTVELIKWIECDSNTNKPKPFKAKKKSGRASAIVEVKSTGELIATSTCDSLTKEIQVRDKTIYHLRKELKRESVPVYRTHWYDMAARWIAVIFILLVTGYILKSLNKIHLP